VKMIEEDPSTEKEAAEVEEDQALAETNRIS
jgi:hypothetical protein